MRSSISPSGPGVPREVRIFTLGSQGRSWEEAVEILLRHPIEQVIDVRQSGFSRRPEFDATRLPGALRELGIGDLSRPELGRPREERVRLWKGGPVGPFHEKPTCGGSERAPSSSRGSGAMSPARRASFGVSNRTPSAATRTFSRKPFGPKGGACSISPRKAGFDLRPRGGQRTGRFHDTVQGDLEPRGVVLGMPPNFL